MKGHNERPLDFSAVLFRRHTLTHTLSVTSQTRPWHLGHLSASSASLCPSVFLTGWHGAERSDVDDTQSKRFVLFAVTSEMDTGVLSLFSHRCRQLRRGNKILSRIDSQLFFSLAGSCLSWASLQGLCGDCNEHNLQIKTNSMTAAVIIKLYSACPIHRFWRNLVKDGVKIIFTKYLVKENKLPVKFNYKILA